MVLIYPKFYSQIFGHNFLENLCIILKEYLWEFFVYMYIRIGCYLILSIQLHVTT